MVLNLPGPYEIRWQVSVGGLTHKHKLNVDVDGAVPAVGTASTLINLRGKDASAVNLAAWIDLLVSNMRGLYSTNASIGAFELWRYPVGTTDALFIASDPSTSLGNAAGSYADAGYEIYTFRTAESNIAKLTLLETVTSSDVQEAFASLSTVKQQLVNFLLSVDSPVLGADTSFLAGFMRASYGRNEAIWRKRHRA